MPELLNLPVPSLRDTKAFVKRVATDAFTGVLDATGAAVSAFDGRSILFALSEFLAHMAQRFELLLREYASQATPFGATGDNLQAWVDWLQIPLPVATRAEIEITVVRTQNTVAGSETLPAGAKFSTVNGLVYETTAPGAFGPVGGPFPQSVAVPARAAAVGSAYNVVNGGPMYLAFSNADYEDPATVTDVTVIGQDPANDADLEQLIRDNFRGANGAGINAWYLAELSALSPVIGGVYIHPAGYGPGSVVLYPLLALDASTAESAPWTVNKPTTGQLDGWETALNDDTRRQTTDTVHVEELATPEIDITLQILPNNASTQADALEALNLRFLQDRPVEPAPMRAGRIDNSEILGAVASLPSITSTTLIDIQPGTDADESNVPSPGADADVYYLAGQVPVVGVVAFM